MLSFTINSSSYILLKHNINSKSSNLFPILRLFSSSQNNTTTAENIYTHLINNPTNPEKTLLGLRPKLDTKCVIDVLNRLYVENSHLGLRFFIWAGAQSKYKHSSYMYGLACKLFDIEKCGCSKISEVFEAYEREKCLVNVGVFKVVLNLCKEGKNCDVGLWVLRKMEERKCVPDSTVYNVVIRLFCEKGDVDKGGKLMNEMEKYGLFPDVITFMAMLKGFCNAGRLEDACRVVTVMKSQKCEPSLVAYTMLLDGLCRIGSFDRALEVLDKMEKEGGLSAPSVITYTTVIQSFCEGGNSIKALEILDRMKSFGCSPNRVTVSVLMKGLCAEGHLGEAYKLIDEIVAGGYVSRGECYSSLMISLLRIKRHEEGLELFRWMLDNGVKPDGLACSMLMKFLCLEGKFLEAFKIYEDVERAGHLLTVDSDIFSVLLDGLSQEDQKVEAAKLVSFMNAKGIQIKSHKLPATCHHL